MIDSDSGIHLAEQATVGALLLAPHQIDRVQGWLRPADFTDPWHAQVYNLIREQHIAGQPVDPQTIATHLLERLGARQAAIVQIHDLLESTPPHPEPAVYGRMVLDAALRREVAGQGVLLRAGALQSALSGESVPMAATCALVDAGLDAVANRWAQATGIPAPVAADAPVPLRAALRNPGLRLSADKLLSVHPGRDQVAEQAHEATLVGALIAHPDEITAVAAWLAPTRITTPIWRTVYAATVELAELGQPVDLVTVTWATMRLSHHEQQCPTLADLREVVDAGRFAVPHHAATVVAADQLRRLAETGSHQLLAGARNPGLLPPDLVDAGRLITGALRQIACALPEHLGEPAAPDLAVVRSLEAAPRRVAR
ncbi:DnaB-like helicase N-terminal domain-containing protein [Cellulomonas sp. P24]|uniref:DnaB-like helicase N-terminal domain-containing protein n=1 Tax=Cellulomonas sp. P24 TaxID=2885206 RepID=UPI00216AB4BA|nr:DnaB-like helicase N-terminal domain-containing protein [Cellulomonas sp. P24]MCR6494534.1 hypothetical protein [Cellulomonas sp. P24]